MATEKKRPKPKLNPNCLVSLGTKPKPKLKLIFKPKLKPKLIRPNSANPNSLGLGHA